MNKQICSHYKVSDMVEVVAIDLIKQAHCLKEEEPTLLDEHNQSVYQESQEKSPPTDYERIDSPLPLPNQVAGQQTKRHTTTGAPFKISLLEMPLDLGSMDKQPLPDEAAAAKDKAKDRHSLQRMGSGGSSYGQRRSM